MNRVDLTDDDVLLAVLAESLAEADPVPAAAIAAATAVALLADADAVLATLVADSLLDGATALRQDIEMEAVGEMRERLLSFSTPQMVLDVDLQANGGVVVGALTPAISADVDLETPGDTRTTRSDELGRFQFLAPPGRCRLRVHTHEGVVVTPWIAR